MPHPDEQRDRLSIPTSSATEAEDLRNQRYSREANAQDLSDADDRARDGAPKRGSYPAESVREEK